MLSTDDTSGAGAGAGAGSGSSGGGAGGGSSGGRDVDVSGGGRGGTVVITYPEDDPQFREQYVGGVVRQRPDGNGVLRWRQGNYVRFEGKGGTKQCARMHASVPYTQHPKQASSSKET